MNFDSSTAVLDAPETEQKPVQFDASSVIPEDEYQAQIKSDPIQFAAQNPASISDAFKVWKSELNAPKPPITAGEVWKGTKRVGSNAFEGVKSFVKGAGNVLDLGRDVATQNFWKELPPESQRIRREGYAALEQAGTGMIELAKKAGSNIGHAIDISEGYIEPEKTDEELKQEFIEKVSQVQEQQAISRGEIANKTVDASLMSSEELAAEGVPVRPEVIGNIGGFVSPVNILPLGAGAKVTESIIAPAVDRLAGNALKTSGVVVDKVGRAATVIGAGYKALTGHPVEAAAALASGSVKPFIANGLKEAGERVLGEAPWRSPGIISGAVTRGARGITGAAKGAISGAEIGTAIGALTSEDPEELAQNIATGATFGLLGGALYGAGDQVVQDRAAVAGNLEKVGSKIRYEQTPGLDDIHTRSVEDLTPAEKKAIDKQRAFWFGARNSEGVPYQIIAARPADFGIQVEKLSGIPASEAAQQNGFFHEPSGIVLVNTGGEHPINTIGHEAGGHVADTLASLLLPKLSEKLSVDLRKNLYSAGRPTQEFQKFIDAYAESLGGEPPLTREQAEDEFLAETAANILKGGDIEKFAVPKPLRESLKDGANRFLRDIGVRSKTGKSGEMGSLDATEIKDITESMSDVLYGIGKARKGFDSTLEASKLVRLEQLEAMRRPRVDDPPSYDKEWKAAQKEAETIRNDLRKIREREEQTPRNATPQESSGIEGSIKVDVPLGQNLGQPGSPTATRSTGRTDIPAIEIETPLPRNLGVPGSPASRRSTARTDTPPIPVELPLPANPARPGSPAAKRASGSTSKEPIKLDAPSEQPATTLSPIDQIRKDAIGVLMVPTSKGRMSLEQATALVNRARGQTLEDIVRNARKLSEAGTQPPVEVTVGTFEPSLSKSEIITPKATLSELPNAIQKTSINIPPPNEGFLETPSWVSEVRDQLVKKSEASGMANKIEELSAQRKTASQVARELGIDKNEVYAVRSERNIPSMDDKTVFEKWISNRNKSSRKPGENIRLSKAQKEVISDKNLEQQAAAPESGWTVIETRVRPGSMIKSGAPKKASKLVVSSEPIKDPTNPSPIEKAFIDRSGPDAVPKITEIQTAIKEGKTIDAVYESTQADTWASTAKERTTEQKLLDEGKTERIPVQKNIQPAFFQIRGNNPSLMGRSLDKVITNAQHVFDYLNSGEATGTKAESVKKDIPFKAIDATFKEKLNQYYENQANGYRGDGKPLAKAGEIGIKANPDYTPHKLTEKEVQFLNLIQGEQGQNFADIAQANERLPIEGRTVLGLPEIDINPLRTRLDSAGFQIRDSKGSKEILHSASEMIRLDRLKSVKPSDIVIPRGSSKIQKSGFQPRSKKRS